LINLAVEGSLLDAYSHVTNWDAQKLAEMLAKGVPVRFIEKRREQPDFQFAVY
jgi:hypothetical protein